MTENPNQVATESTPESVDTEPDVSSLTESELDDLIESAGYVYLRSDERPDLAVDIKDESSRSGASIIFVKSNAGAYSQQWSFQRVRDDDYVIVSRHSGLCLSVLDSSREDGAPIIQLPNRVTDDQVWRFKYDRVAERHTFTCVQNNKRLTTPEGAKPGTRLVQSSRTGNSDQFWVLGKVEEN